VFEPGAQKHVEVEAADILFMIRNLHKSMVYAAMESIYRDLTRIIDPTHQITVSRISGATKNVTPQK
jgi:hypothetical protein